MSTAARFILKWLGFIFISVIMYRIHSATEIREMV